MIILNSVTFKDDETGKIFEVHIPDGNVTSDQSFTPDEYTTCSFHAGLLLAGGFSKIKEFANIKK
ncbi:MAG: hypothetical protein HFJ38_07105 [Bacilli bacterium]|nr:hypothetical protein [Bacilli bacterium]